MTNAERDQRRNNVIEVLNKARSMELHAITQYMNQHYGLDDMDYGELAKQVKLVALDEMRHAEMFAERIKELGGEPTAELCCDVERKQPVERIFPFDAHQEDDTIDQYNQFLMTCRDNGDSTSQKIFETIIEEEQMHYNYFDAVAGHIEKLGDVFLSKIAGTPASTGLADQGFAVTKGE